MIQTNGPQYGKDKSEETYQHAMALIKERLPSMKKLNAVLVVNLGKEDILVDARAEYLVHISEGKLEPRYALFKDGFFHEASLPQGDVSVAIRFGDLLRPECPSPLTTFDNKEKAQLPQPTTDLEQVKADMAQWGYGLVKNALSPEEVATYKQAIVQQAAGEAAAGVAARDGGPHSPNQRIWTLINKGQEFVDLLQHPLIDEIVPEMLGDNPLIHSYSANIARPGNVPMQLHTDQVAIQPPVRDMAFGLNIMWFLEDVTAANGGTRVYPGSHLGNVAPDNIFDISGSVAAEGPSGTALVFESRLWHATGPNIEKTGERPVILMFFMRSFIRQQENNFLSLREDVEAKLPDKIKALLGYRTTGALGGVEGDVREGTFVKKLANPVGALLA